MQRSTDYPAVASVSMIKNERDIIELFTSHVCAIADLSIIVDHSSTDGTAEFLADLAETRDDVLILEYEEPSYDQALLMNEIVRSHPRLDDFDWVLFLDADEFVPNDVDLRKLFAEHATEHAVALYWHNTPLVDYNASVVRPTSEIWIGPRHGHHTTIAVNMHKFRDSDSWVDQGNHELLTHQFGRPRRLKHVAPVLHLPIRSWQQFLRKIDQGDAAYRAQGENRNREFGQHWAELKNLSSARHLNDGHINSIVLSYGLSGVPPAALQDEELLNMGFTRATLPILTDETVETMLEHDTEPAQGAPLGLTIEDGSIRRSDSEPMRFAELEAAPESTADRILSDDEFVLAQLDPAMWAISDLTPTAWGGHIPFMFTLFGMHRPQRYAELGSHFGASFFAACQASERLMLDTECVAIDTWAGDDHTGAYDNHVYESFCSIVDRRNYTNARMLRMYFHEAAELFDDGSVDLLHIDGLHTYEAVRHDFETWLPKMAPGAIVLFHDTNVHERDFGVWRLWDELKDEYQTFEFQHSHGLGVLVIPGGSGGNVERFIEILNKRPRLASFVQHHFESLAPRILIEARLRYINTDASSGDVGDLINRAAHAEEERARLALEVGALHRERADWGEAYRRNSPFVLVKSSIGRTKIGQRLAPLYRHLTRGS